MDIDIVAADPADAEVMAALATLGDDLAAADVHAEAAEIALQGVKDGGLTAGLAIAGVAMTAVTTTLQVLQFWASKRPKYTVTLTTDTKEFEIEGLDQAGAEAAVQELTASGEDGRLVVRVEGS